MITKKPFNNRGPLTGTNFALSVEQETDGTVIIRQDDPNEEGDSIYVYDGKALRKLVKALKALLPPKVESTDEAR